MSESPHHHDDPASQPGSGPSGEQYSAPQSGPQYAPPPQGAPYGEYPPSGHGPSYQGYPSGHVPGAYGPRPGTDDTSMAMIAHLTGMINLIAWPFGFVGPLVIYLTRKDQSPYARDQGAEALNFQITLSIAFIAVTVVGLILTIVGVGVIILALGLPALWIAALVFGIMASTAANRGENYRYPVNLRMVT